MIRWGIQSNVQFPYPICFLCGMDPPHIFKPSLIWRFSLFQTSFFKYESYYRVLALYSGPLNRKKEKLRGKVNPGWKVLKCPLLYEWRPHCIKFEGRKGRGYKPLDPPIRGERVRSVGTKTFFFPFDIFPPNRGPIWEGFNTKWVREILTKVIAYSLQWAG